MVGGGEISKLQFVVFLCVLERREASVVQIGRPLSGMEAGMNEAGIQR